MFGDGPYSFVPFGAGQLGSMYPFGCDILAPSLMLQLLMINGMLIDKSWVCPKSVSVHLALLLKGDANDKHISSAPFPLSNPYETSKAESTSSRPRFFAFMARQRQM